MLNADHCKHITCGTTGNQGNYIISLLVSITRLPWPETVSHAGMPPRCAAEHANHNRHLTLNRTASLMASSHVSPREPWHHLSDPSSPAADDARAS